MTSNLTGNERIKMNVTMLTRARENFSNPLAPRAINRHNMRAWVKSVRFLQTQSKKKWLLQEQIAKKEAA